VLILARGPRGRRQRLIHFILQNRAFELRVGETNLTSLGPGGGVAYPTWSFSSQHVWGAIIRFPPLTCRFVTPTLCRPGRRGCHSMDDCQAPWPLRRVILSGKHSTFDQSAPASAFQAGQAQTGQGSLVVGPASFERGRTRWSQHATNKMHPTRWHAPGEHSLGSIAYLHIRLPWRASESSTSAFGGQHCPGPLAQDPAQGCSDSEPRLSRQSAQWVSVSPGRCSRPMAVSSHDELGDLKGRRNSDSPASRQLG